MCRQLWGPRFEQVYRSTALKQERGAQIEAIREEVFQAFAGHKKSAESDLMATAIQAAAASLGGVGGLGPSTSNPDLSPTGQDPASDDEDEELDYIDPASTSNQTDNAEITTTTTAAATADTRDDMPSIPPPDKAEEEDTSPSGSASTSGF